MRLRPVEQRVRTTVVATAMMVLPTFAQAQERRLATGDSVMPTSLFLAFANQPSMLFVSGGAETVVLVGRIPAALEARLPRPTGSRILGTISLPSMDLIAFESDASSDSVGAFIRQELPQRGWRVVNQGGGGGFRPAGSVITSWCGGSSMLTYAVESTGARSTRVSYSMRQEDMGACNPRGMMLEQYLPILFNPEDADSFPTACNNAFGNARSLSTGTAAMIRSQMSPSQLIEYYGTQLVDSGWTLPSSSGDAAMATQTWQKRQSDGSMRTTTITITAPPKNPGCRMLELRVGGVNPR